mgnify:CR=1 FL=1|jgi:hypothetical protein
MRFLKTLTLNRRAIYDDRLAINTSSEVIMNTTASMLIPHGTGVQRTSNINGMIRYNADTKEFEGYQGGVAGASGGGAWRAFRFKESTKLIVQPLGVGDDFEKTFGPLTPNPFDPSIIAETGTTWNEEQIAQNLLVINETIWQIGGTSYDFIVVQNPSYMHPVGTANAGNPYAPGTYIKFVVAIALGRPVYVIHNAGR